MRNNQKLDLRVLHVFNKRKTPSTLYRGTLPQPSAELNLKQCLSLSGVTIGVPRLHSIVVPCRQRREDIEGAKCFVRT